MKRLETFNHAIGEYDYTLPKTPDSDYIVDDSCFIPIEEAVKQLGTSSYIGESEKAYYDFADGRDTGIKVPITRTKDGKDIAEISSAIMSEVDTISDEINSVNKINAKRKAFDDKLKSISTVKNDNSGDSK